MTHYYQAYICPKCSANLYPRENTLVCKNNHCFDVAKEGYVNLLLANQKSSLNPGDSKEMILARNKFLNAEYYDFLIKSILNLDIIICDRFKNILEIGCGSGYYFNWLNEKLKPGIAIGSDISKEAIKFAAKKYKNIDFVVANSFNFPFKDVFFDLVVSIFSPFSNSEVERIIAQNGLFIMVRPGKNHFKELYDLLGIPIKNKTYPNFSQLKLIESKEIEKKTSLTSEDLHLLVQMTPLFWKIKDFNLNIANLSEITFDFLVNIYKKI